MMTNPEIHLELLLGKKVRDSSGQFVGRIQEIRVEQQGDEWFIQEYLIGAIAIIERLSAWTIGLGLLNFLGARKIHGGYQVSWDKLDLSEPNYPRLHCTLQELDEIHQSSRTPKN